MASWFKTQRRRLEQGVLEGLGVASSSKDESFDKDAARYKRLEESLLKLNASCLSYVSAIKRASETSEDVISSLDSLGASDLKHGVTARTPDAVARQEGLVAMIRSHAALRSTVVRSVETLILDRITNPVGALLRSLPVLKRALDHRRQCLTDYDAYRRKHEGAQKAGDAPPGDLAKAEGKVRAAAAALSAARDAVSRMLSAGEEQRAVLQREASRVMVGAQVHLAAHASDALAPLLPRHPEAASVMVELAGAVAHLAAVATRPSGLPSLGDDGAPATAPAGSPVASDGAGSSTGVASSTSAGSSLPTTAAPTVFASLSSAAAAPRGIGLPGGLRLSDDVLSGPLASGGTEGGGPTGAAAVGGDEAAFAAAVAASFADLHAAVGVAGNRAASRAAQARPPASTLGSVSSSVPPSARGPATAPAPRPVMARPATAAGHRALGPRDGGGPLGAPQRSSSALLQPLASSASGARATGTGHEGDSDDEEEDEGDRGDEEGAAAAAAAGGAGDENSDDDDEEDEEDGGGDARSAASTVPSPVLAALRGQGRGATGDEGFTLGDRASPPTAPAVPSHHASSSSHHHHHRHPTQRPPPGSLAVAVFDFSPENPDELPLRRGATVHVLDRGDGDGWWVGRLLAPPAPAQVSGAPPPSGSASSGATGLFPSNYVRVLDAGDPAYDAVALPPPHYGEMRGSGLGAGYEPSGGAGRGRSSSGGDGGGGVGTPSHTPAGSASSLLNDLAYVSATGGGASWTQAEAEEVARLRDGVGLLPSASAGGGPPPEPPTRSASSLGRSLTGGGLLSEGIPGSPGL